MANKLLIIAAGGTGGHMFPAQALAEEMLNRGWRVKLSTDERGARYVDGFPKAVAVEVVSAGTFAQGGLAAKFLVPFRILAGGLSAWIRMRKDPPAVVAGFGGYPALPAMLAAILIKTPTLVHEQNGVLGRVNQLLAKRMNAVACGMWPTKLPGGVEGVFIGNPVRTAILDRANSGYIPPGDWPMSVLAMGGSQGSRILSQIIPAAMALLPQDMKSRLRVAQQAREEDYDNTVAAYVAADVIADVQPFFDDVPSRMSECQLVITRSGASSVADVSTIGRPSILIPLGIAIRDEQTVNAKGLANAGAAVVVSENELTAGVLAGHIQTILSNKEKAMQMAAAALTQARPEAARDLADLVSSLVKD